MNYEQRLYNRAADAPKKTREHCAAIGAEADAEIAALRGNFDAQIAAWGAKPQHPGRPSCPCGFASGCSTICAHRRACPVWSRYATVGTERLDEKVDAERNK